MRVYQFNIEKSIIKGLSEVAKINKETLTVTVNKALKAYLHTPKEEKAKRKRTFMTFLHGE